MKVRITPRVREAIQERKRAYKEFLKTIMAFNDATCPKCGNRYGWMGTLLEKPPCDKCGFLETAEELEKVHQEEQLLYKELMSDLVTTGDKKAETAVLSEVAVFKMLKKQAVDLKRKRESLGWTTQDVFELTSLRPKLIEMIESGTRIPTEEQLKALWSLYNS